MEGKGRKGMGRGRGRYRKRSGYEDECMGMSIYVEVGMGWDGMEWE
jgi:hypothetical protein